MYGSGFFVGNGNVVERVNTEGLLPCCLETLVVARKDATQFAYQRDTVICVHCGKTIEFDGEVWRWKNSG